MPVRQLDPSADARDPDVDWEGNNAAFTCPKCNQVFVVSAQLHPEGRRCPACSSLRGWWWEAEGPTVQPYYHGMNRLISRARGEPSIADEPSRRRRECSADGDSRPRRWRDPRTRFFHPLRDQIHVSLIARMCPILSGKTSARPGPVEHGRTSGVKYTVSGSGGARLSANARVQARARTSSRFMRSAPS